MSSDFSLRCSCLSRILILLVASLAPNSVIAQFLVAPAWAAVLSCWCVVSSVLWMMLSCLRMGSDFILLFAWPSEVAIFLSMNRSLALWLWICRWIWNACLSNSLIVL